MAQTITTKCHGTVWRFVKMQLGSKTFFLSRSDRPCSCLYHRGDKCVGMETIDLWNAHLSSYPGLHQHLLAPTRVILEPNAVRWFMDLIIRFKTVSFLPIDRQDLLHLASKGKKATVLLSAFEEYNWAGGAFSCTSVFSRMHRSDCST